jgi:hypothetical protein
MKPEPVFKPFESMTLKDYATGGDVLLEGAAERVAEYIAHLKDMRQAGKGLTIVGPPGVGKTMLACAVLNAARRFAYKTEDLELDEVKVIDRKGVERWRLLVKKGAIRYTYQTEAIRFSDYLRLEYQRMDLLQRMQHDSPSFDGEHLDEIEVRLERIGGYSDVPFGKQTHWVLFDDVGSEHTSESDFTAAKLNDLLRHRYSQRLPFLLTSNLVGDDWAKRYSPALASFLAEATTFVVVNGPDYRLKNSHELGATRKPDNDGKRLRRPPASCSDTA